MMAGFISSIASCFINASRDQCSGNAHISGLICSGNAHIYV